MPIAANGQEPVIEDYLQVGQADPSSLTLHVDPQLVQDAFGFDGSTRDVLFRLPCPAHLEGDAHFVRAILVIKTRREGILPPFPGMGGLTEWFWDNPVEIRETHWQQIGTSTMTLNMFDPSAVPSWDGWRIDTPTPDTASAQITQAFIHFEATNHSDEVTEDTLIVLD